MLTASIERKTRLIIYLDQESYDDAVETTHPQNNLSVSIPQSSSTRSLTDSPPSGSGATPQFTEAPSLASDTLQNEDKVNDSTDKIGSDGHSDSEETPRKKKLHKSPLLTAHRLSTTSLDDVNLAGSKEDETVVDGVGQEPKANSPQPQSTDSSHLQGLSGSLPSVPWGPPPINKNPPPAATTAPPPPPTRKLTSPFAWLSRSSTGGRETKSPPQSKDVSRRNTSASVSTVSSNPELASRQQDLNDANGTKPRSNSLKDQFKLLRMREESGTISENGEVNGEASGSPPSIPEQSESDAATAPPTVAPAVSPDVPPTVNPNLAPGTVSGYSASATDASAPVDWELWQQLVNHGPQAVHSSEALNAAIKRGIPQTIRGVIWQVLADSRNAELEEVYRELAARGTDKEKERQRNSNGQINGISEESLSSSRSSVRSDNSASGAHSTNGSSSPSQDPESEKQTKDPVIEAAQKKKAKDDSLALQKLEKTIRRDLGARTSYSRYFVSQGNQEGLFGICKAYALYDEQVGYAQGMNFIAMPLLFNVSSQSFLLWTHLTQN